MNVTQERTGVNIGAGDNGFNELGFGARVEAIVSRNGLKNPTPIQAKAIPVALAGEDLVGIAQTGTGKTLAFLLPLVDRILAGKSRRGLVLAPTRELAQQIEEVAQKFAYPLGIRSTVLIGGASMRRQVEQLRSTPAIVIATPGRLQDHVDSRTMSLRDFDVAILDEADRMLDMGFLPAVTKILDLMPGRNQTMLFSATMPNEIEALTGRFMRKPVKIEIERAGTVAEGIQQQLMWLNQPEKGDMLDSILRKSSGTVLVFARTRHGARKLAKSLRMLGHSAAEIHSDRTMAQRKMALDGFKAGDYRVLVATDIASRGIDVKNIGMVVNYDLPDNPEDYVHRIGRTGRAGESGVAVTFAMPDQQRLVRDIEKVLGSRIDHSTDGQSRPAERAGSSSPQRKFGSAGPSRGGPRHASGGHERSRFHKAAR